MQRYANPIVADPKIISGESGAVTLGLVEAIMQNEAYAPVRSQLELDQNSRVLLFSTEGDTDPDIYQSLMQGESLGRS